MTAEQLWQKAGLAGEYEAWAFTDVPDKLAALVCEGIKTATCSSYDVSIVENEPIPKVGDYSVILDSKGDAVCIVRTSKITICPFKDVTEEHAYKEGEGDRSLDYWRQVHKEFLESELGRIGMAFSEKAKVICEEFELIEL
ncbi:Uncharacterized protein YhfF [Acetitomaculum ruminis DSM 5522]|uniref:Uncharacterized protein YhfF n=1 Tax=Acetitomaculum ruminis DSM 5522 TaxID=1120918 RepID=A0A1I1ANZ1_9FIRM|nr:ASCH domain-containing protein [Acetitomaculum ruminis]SFB38090.1 Uncharacterized protein YhfF [Acetitomaculum ruminis DSM 5522]